MAHYIPHTPSEVKEMLDVIGVKTVEDLFAEIPAALQLDRTLKIPSGLTEPEMAQRMRNLASRNTDTSQAICFLGGGIYDHYIPAAIDHLLLRGDLFTVYTPYQAEISQGTLQSIYEFQSLISGLTGMNQANASMYEGATALSEAILMAVAHKKKSRVIISAAVHPEYRQVSHTLCETVGTQIVPVPYDDGTTDVAKLAELINEDTAAVVVQYPNFFGSIEDLETISEIAKSVNAMLIVSTNPIALGLLTPPGEFGADIVTGEGQPMGIPMSYGGPSLGFLAANKPLLRKMPGRIAGCTTDVDGNRGFVLTLQAREQHIRREKAGSNICSNQALMALCSTIYMSLLGAEGLKEVAEQSFQKAHYLKNQLTKIPGVLRPSSAPFFNEFVVKVPDARKTMKRLAKKGIFGGLILENWYPELRNHVLIAVTEKRTMEEMTLFVEQLGGLLA